MFQNSSDTLYQLLKNQSRSFQKEASQVPYIANLLRNNIKLESYVGHLRAFAIIYGTLERQVDTIQDSSIKSFLHNYKRRLPLILRDLEYFGSGKIKDIIPSVSIALKLADAILLCKEKNPVRLLGFLYAIDELLEDGSVFRNHISEIFKLTGDNGTAYFSAGNGDFRIFRREFAEKLNAELPDITAKEEVLAASAEIFNAVISIYRCLYPVEEKNLGNHVTALNPEAGNHPIPTDPAEIEAAISAGLTCWNEFPFYEKRYGERGRRFAVSDSAWLVILSDLPESLAGKQVKWLAEYLAVKGMPTITMEIQLNLLFHELAGKVPGKKEKYLIFRTLSEKLKERRIQKVPEEVSENSNTIFNHYYEYFKVRDEMMENTGKLIAASIADSKNGIEESPDNFRSWIMNPLFFSHEWILAVENTYSSIENLLKQPGS